jgi:nitrate/TMAO reductase-like tetraheme cytochrome c subunit
MWLLFLYGFLALTTVAVLASLGVLAVGLLRLGIAILILLPIWVIVNLGIAYGVHRTAYALESHDSFCVSCHLHENEFKRFRDEASSVALDLAGYHWRHGKQFACITCHVGEGIDGRARVLFFAGMDVVHYTTGRFRKELKGMERPLGDASCTKCHAPSNPGEFHKSEKHSGYVTGCLTCHLAHSRTDEAFGFIDYIRWPAEKTGPCLTCHPGLLR